MYNTTFERIREDALSYMSNKNKNIIENWCKECGTEDPVGYYNDYSKHELIIYTTRPGIMIGFHGENINKFKEVLKAEFDYEYTINFVEIKGKIVNY